MWWNYFSIPELHRLIGKWISSHTSQAMWLLIHVRIISRRWDDACAHKTHDFDVTMDPMASQITSLMIVYSTVHSGADQRKHQSSASLAFARGIHRSPVNSPHKWPVTWKRFPFDDVNMIRKGCVCSYSLVVWCRSARANSSNLTLTAL